MPVKSYKMGPGELRIGEVGTEVDFSAQVSACRVAWSVERGDSIPVLSGEELTQDPTWSASLSATLVQDLSAAGIVDFSWTNKGDQVPFVFIPSDAEARQVTGTVEVRPIDVGGDVRTRPTSDIEWPCVGEPQFGAAV